MTSNNTQQECSDNNLVEEDSMKNRFLTFNVGNEHYGIEIVHVTEIAGMQAITHVPDMPTFVQGVINLRGQVIPVIDARKRFKLSAREYDDRTCFIVLRINEIQIGLVVDRVEEVLNINPEDISAPPILAGTQRNYFIKGLGKVNQNVKIIIDGEKLIDGNADIPDSDSLADLSRN